MSLKIPPFVFLAVKIAGSIAAIALIIYKIDWLRFLIICQKTDVFIILFAFTLYNLSQIVSALRCRLYLNLIGLPLSHGQNLSLYYASMLYNLFLPGGIGGDGFKIFQLRRYSGIETMVIVKALLFDRLNGLLGLIIVAFFAFYWSSLSVYLLPALWASPVILAMLVVVSANIQRSWFSPSTFAFVLTLIYSVFGQLLQMCAALVLLYGLGVRAHFPLYGLIFLCSSIVAQAPITLGGVGAREITVLTTLGWLGLQTEAGLAMAMLFFVIQTLSNALGLFWYGYHLQSL